VINPSLEMFQAFAEYCKTGYAPLQLMVISSYSQMRIWKINPYQDCPHGTDGGKNCYNSQVRGIDVPGSFVRWDMDIAEGSSACEEKFVTMVTALEYIDEMNIAVTVMNTTMLDFDFYQRKLVENPTSTTYDILYLDHSSDTMSLSKSPHINIDTALSGASMLCPAMKRMPNFGSLITEGFVGLVRLSQIPLNMLVNLPG
jgi:hypothetical protein